MDDQRQDQIFLALRVYSGLKHMGLIEEPHDPLEAVEYPYTWLTYHGFQLDYDEWLNMDEGLCLRALETFSDPSKEGRLTDPEQWLRERGVNCGDSFQLDWEEVLQRDAELHRNDPARQLLEAYEKALEREDISFEQFVRGE